MTPQQEADLRGIKDKITLRIDAKYRRGQKEHGGNLWERAALPDMADEVTDLNTYFVTLENQLKQMHTTLQQAQRCLNEGNWTRAVELLDELDAGFRLQLRQS